MPGLHGGRAGRLAALSMALVAGACGGSPPDASSGAGDWFLDGTAAAGLDFLHVSGRTGRYELPEIMGPGVGLFDYDNDGDLDLYVVQGHPLGSGARAGDHGEGWPTGRLYRNDLSAGPDGSPAPHFTDVTRAAGIDARGYGMGVAAGDFTNDGWVDLYLTNFGPNQLLRNNGDGTFTDVTAESGTAGEQWSVSASVADFDRDGWLDLYVGNYVGYRIGAEVSCRSSIGEPDYCNPQNFDPVPDRLYHNLGDGTFLDVTAAAHVSQPAGPTLGVIATDFDNDGWLDIYVAHDGRANQAWLNLRNGTFRDVALIGGMAVNERGQPEASMGVDAADFDGDGDEDLLMTHFDGETNTLYVNDGQGLFEDRSAQTGLGAPSLSYTGFGMRWVDVDNDGWLDVVAVNGAVRTIEALARVDDPFPFHQPNQVFRNLGDGRFADVTGQAGAAFARSEVSRGAAFGDIDNDGDVDVVVGTNGGPLHLLLNRIGNRRHWLGVRLVDAAGGRDMLGTRVGVLRRGAATLWRRARTDGSYASAGDPRVLAGLGASGDVEAVRVTWPGGATEVWREVSSDRWITLVRGTGARLPAEGP